MHSSTQLALVNTLEYVSHTLKYVGTTLKEFMLVLFLLERKMKRKMKSKLKMNQTRRLET